MKITKDSPGVYLPPPLLYAGFFGLSILLQKLKAIPKLWLFDRQTSGIFGVLFIVGGIAFIWPALRQFIRSKNTVVLIKPATSLQTKGIYSISRNPMYLGLLLIYTGLACRFGNGWTILLIPVLIATVSQLIIVPEEKYLMRAFPNDFAEYKKRIRRWL